MSPRRVKKSSTAYADLEAASDYFFDDVSIRIGHRFLDATEATFQKLASMPSLGAFLDTKLLKTPGIRTWTVKGFERYVILYREIADGIEVLRVVHGSRNWEDILDHSE